MIWLVRLHDSRDHTRVDAVETDDDSPTTVRRIASEAIQGYGMGDWASVEVTPVTATGKATRFAITAGLEEQG